MEERKNKSLYYLELSLLKLLPALIALIYFIWTLLNYYNIDTFFLSHLSGISVLPLIFLYVSSYVFKFCEYHRMFLHYISLNLILNMVDWYVGIPLNNLEYISLFLIISCIFLFIILYLYLKTKNEKSN